MSDLLNQPTEVLAGGYVKHLHIEEARARIQRPNCSKP
jgi:hypothetical protein